MILPDRRLQIENRLSAAHFDEPPGQRAVIDLFFRSEAGRLGNGAVVILSGAGSDGAIGVKAVKEAGGAILVQDPGESESSSMSRSAIATGLADLVLPVREIVARLELVRLRRNRHAMRQRLGVRYDMRIRRSRTIDNKIDGVVITFVDITERLQTENALREGESQLLRQKQLVSWSHRPYSSGTSMAQSSIGIGAAKNCMGTTPAKRLGNARRSSCEAMPRTSGR